MRIPRLLAALSLVVLAVLGTTTPAVAAEVVLPPVNGRFDYQLGGAYRPLASVAIVSRDRTATPEPGRYNVCYVNAFQTQPDERAFWLDASRRDLILRRDGVPVADPGWPGELLLDTSTAAKRTRIAAVVGGWIDGCATAGFQAVEPDNMDSWTRAGGLLTRAQNLALTTLLAQRAHAAGLAIAQKNTLEFGRAGRDVAHLDFAIVEECQRYRECDGYTAVYGDRVIEIEYTDYPRAVYVAACAARGASVSVMRRDRDVVPRGDAAYRYEAC